MKNIKFLLSLMLLMPFALLAQDSSDSDVEEVVVVGSQIKGAKITGVLPVSIISAEDVDALGIDSGDELLENLVEQGNNFFNESEETWILNNLIYITSIYFLTLIHMYLCCD